ncbi:DUF4810 domain-containing protein [Salinimicrobium sp. MT39]|uniref:DUF4810 domain-containing protein n=1 Tax=Salinimicrobium profundisediminis TaxID=2994553 RepID=A0A9X3I0K9_9FLAO|nr:DUF4810 domain-containing protein [Salinimicrobium profundisediminis]MCX2838115.1 DUF4810 domain-containing protein [Salinimicrobium profundisediminis]
MKKIILLFSVVILAMSCSAPKQLYSWEKYEAASYNYIKNSDEASLVALLENYEKVISKQKGTRGVVPPGIHADYGFILMKTGRLAEGKDMLAKEIQLYPESKIFIDRILKMTEL